jgi:hypothetical protein
MATQDRDSALTTLELVKRELGNEEVEDDNDRLEELIDQLSGAISVHCNRKFQQAPYTKYLNGNGRSVLLLPHWPITSPLVVPAVAAVAYSVGPPVVEAVEAVAAVAGGIWLDSTRQFDSDSLLVEAVVGEDSGATGDFIVYPDEEGRGRVERLYGVWTVGVRNIKAVWQGGYLEIPGDVERACRLWVVHAYQMAKGGHQIEVSTTIQPGGGNISIVERGIPKDVASLLTKWRPYVGKI